MKKLLMASLGVLLLVQFSGGIASSQSVSTPTTCPINYTCSLLLTGTAPLAGLPNDGHPDSIIGFLNFDAQGNVSGVVSVNINGVTVTNHPVSGAVCTSGSASTLGKISLPITMQGGTQFTLVEDFVTYVTSTGQDLLLSDESQTTPADSPVSAGVCRASFAG